MYFITTLIVAFMFVHGDVPEKARVEDEMTRYGQPLQGPVPITPPAKG